MPVGRLPFSDPRMIEFNEANQAYRNACKRWYKIRRVIGNPRAASAENQLLYYRESEIYKDACKAYNVARNKFHQEVEAIYNPFFSLNPPEPSIYDALKSMEPLSGDAKILEESVKIEQQKTIAEHDPTTQSLLALFQRKKERGDIDMKITSQDKEEFKEIEKTIKSPMSSTLSSLDDEIKLPEE